MFTNKNLAKWYGGDNLIDPDTTLEDLILTSKNTPNSTVFFVITLFYNQKNTTNNRAQIAVRLQ